ncbi:MAG: hypothetical protein WAX57_03975 [Minisyncoccia bacterium]
MGLALAFAVAGLAPAPSAFAQEDDASKGSIERRMKDLEAKLDALSKKVNAPMDFEIQTEPSARPFCQQWNVGPGSGTVVLLPCAPGLGQKTWHLVPKK